MGLLSSRVTAANAPPSPPAPAPTLPRGRGLRTAPPTPALYDESPPAAPHPGSSTNSNNPSAPAARASFAPARVPSIAPASLAPASPPLRRAPGRTSHEHARAPR